MGAIILSLITTLLVNGTASADIFSKDPSDTNGIRVNTETIVNGYNSEGTIEKRSVVSFDICEKEPWKRDLFNCEPLLDGNFFEVRHIERQRLNEYTNVVGALGADVVMVLGGMIAGSHIVPAFLAGHAASVGMVAVGSSINPPGLGAGIVIGASVGVLASGLFSRLNPWNQYQEARTVSSPILNDEDVFINGSILRFAERLETVLSKLQESAPRNQQGPAVTKPASLKRQRHLAFSKYKY